MIHHDSFRDGKTQKASILQEYIIFCLFQDVKALCDVGVGVVMGANIHSE